MGYELPCMNGQPPNKPYFWPLVFLTAFLLGAVLRRLSRHRARAVQQTRERRDMNFFVPRNSPPESTNAPATPAPPKPAAPNTNGPV